MKGVVNMRKNASTTVLLKAVQFAADKHRKQRRKGKDASPYINHPIGVAHLLADVGGITDIDTLVAAILHDTVEDTKTTLRELEKQFGRAVRSVVEELTDDKSKKKALRKRLQIEHAPHLSRQAKAIKMADKISNVQDVTEHPPKKWRLARRIAYLNWTEKVVAGCRGTSDGLERYYDKALKKGRAKLGAPNITRAPAADRLCARCGAPPAPSRARRSGRGARRPRRIGVRAAASRTHRGAAQ